MAKADRLKEEIGWLKVLSGLCAALDASLIAWLAQNYETANAIVTATAICLATGFIAAVVAAILRLYRCLKLLEAL